MINKFKSDNGVTVLTLIITVILLLILAAVSLGTLFDGEWLLGKSNDAASRYNQSKDDESSILGSMMNQIDKYNGIYGTETSGTVTPSITPSITPSNTPTITPSLTPTPTPSTTPGESTEKKDGRLILSSTSGTVIYPNEGMFAVKENSSGGKLSVKSSDDSVASASIAGNAVTIIPKEISESEKKVIITVTSAETGNYKKQTATYIATIKQGGIKLEATITTRQYSGTPFDAITSVNVYPTDAKVEYSLNEGAYSSTIPQITDAGEYTVAIRATKAGYETKEITKNVTINKQALAGSLMLSGTSGTITYPNTGTFTVINNASGGALRVSSSDDSVATARISGNTVTIIPAAVTESGKKATITVTSTETENYEEQTAIYVVTVNQGEITISAKEYIGQADGNAHNAITEVSVEPTDATLTYSLDGGEYSETIPQISEIDIYVIKIKATRLGYVDSEIEKLAIITAEQLPEIGTTPPEAGWTVKEAQALVERDGLQAHIGEKVRFNPSAGGTWRIFYYDNEVNSEDSTKGYFGDELGTLYLKRDCDSIGNSLLAYESYNPVDEEVLRNMNPKWSTSSAGASIDLNNEHCVAWLSDPKKWNDSYSVTGVSKYAIGGPSVEMYMKAFNIYKDNDPNSTTLINRVRNLYGYDVGARDSYTWKDSNTSRSGTDSIEAGPNNIFMTKSDSWWLSSPSSGSGGYVLFVSGYNHSIDFKSTDVSKKFCPVVAIMKPTPPEESITIEEAKELVERDGLQEHIGKKVDYGAGGTWRIFYYDNEPNSSDPTKGYFGDPLGTLYLKKDCGAEDTTLDSYASSYVNKDGLTAMKKMNPKWLASVTSGGASLMLSWQAERCTSWLCDTTQWTRYKISGVAEYAIGGPSVEMYMKAYNVYKDNDPNSTSLINNMRANTRGYEVGANNSACGWVTANKSVESGPHDVFLGGNWWLSSPSCRTTNLEVYSVNSDYKRIGTAHCTTKYATSPIVALKK